MSTYPEPAIKSYFFGKGYLDLRDTIAESWRLNMKSASEFWDKISFDDWEDAFKSLLNGAAAVSVVVFGTAFFLVASLVHIVLLLSFFLLIYVGFTAVYLSERVYLLVKGFWMVCPKCHADRLLPEYYCDGPGCTNVHSQLIPSSYGILRHTCRCGQRLPATFFMKRDRLQARCRACKTLVKPEHLASRKIFVAVMGGPSVGKSSYMFSSMWKLLEEKLPSQGFSYGFVDDRDRNDYNTARDHMERGRPPDKTTEKVPSAFNVFLRTGTSQQRLLYLYDPAGEAYEDDHSLVLHKYQKYLSGCIFLIDPFSIPFVKERYSRELASTGNLIKPGRVPLEDAFSRMILSLEEHFGLNRTRRIKFPIVVVINKLDAFDLEDQLGSRAIDKQVKSSHVAVDPGAIRDEVVRKQLRVWGEGGFVQRVEERFASVHYFACSSLGRLAQGPSHRFEPRNVLDPLVWLLSEADRRIAIAQRLTFAAIGAGVLLLVVALAFFLWPSTDPSASATRESGVVQASAGNRAMVGPTNSPPPKSITSAVAKVSPGGTPFNAAAKPSPIASLPATTNDGDTAVAPDALLSISANVEGVQVTIDGRPYGLFSASPRRVRLPAGRHNITATKADYVNWQQSVNLNPNSGARVSIAMAPTGPPPHDLAIASLRRAELLLQQGRYDDAINQCDEGLRAEPGNQALLSKRSAIERISALAHAPTLPHTPVSQPSPSVGTASRFQPASALRRVSPEYPSFLRSARLSGSVLVEVEIDEWGDVTSARAVKGQSIFYQTALDAAKQWKYRPARNGDQPIRTRQTILFNFTP